MNNLFNMDFFFLLNVLKKMKNGSLHIISNGNVSPEKIFFGAREMLECYYQDKDASESVNSFFFLEQENTVVMIKGLNYKQAVEKLDDYIYYYMAKFVDLSVELMNLNSLDMIDFN